MRCKAAIVASLLIAPAIASAATAASGFKLTYLYDLSSFSGVYRGGASALTYDPAGKELLLVGGGLIRAYDNHGMEVYQFGDDLDVGLGSIIAVAATDDGTFFALSYEGGNPILSRRNFRGDVIERIEPSAVPPEHAGLKPNVVRYAAGRVYLVNTAAMRVLVLNADGSFAKGYDFRTLLELDPRQEQTEINGFDVDADGSMLFVVATQFKAYVVSPGGDVRSWGRPGGAPGRFNIAAGIGTDGSRYFVLDSLKGAIIVFDKSFNFLGEFGGFGRGPGQLFSAVNIAVGGGRVYVGQMGGRGVAVYEVSGS